LGFDAAKRERNPSKNKLIDQERVFCSKLWLWVVDLNFGGKCEG
jgi:hypothetical protein